MTSADFAAAQARIAERRKARQGALQSQQQLKQQQLHASAFVRLPGPLRELCISAWSQWDHISSRHGTQPAFRVGQVDAELLDEELMELLKGQVEEALKYYGQHLRNDWHAEIQLALRSVLFKLTIWDHDSSYGAALQNLKYTDARNVERGGLPDPATRWQKSLYGLISVGGRYAWGKWNDYLLDLEGDYEEPSPRMKLLSRLSQLASTSHSVAAFASFLVFLLNGKYRTILDRLLRLRLTPTASQVSREVSFEYLNRQLVWHAFTEFLLFLLPLVGISRWRRWIARAWRKTKLMFRSDTAGEGEDEKAGGELGFLPERTCAICYQDQNPTSASEGEIAAISAASSGVVGSAATDVTNPYETSPCGCIYCFVCIAQRLEAEDNEGWTCLRCGEIVRECQPWSGDVALSKAEARKSFGSSSKLNKRVSFREETKQEPEEDKDQGEQAKESFQALDPMPLDDDKAAPADISSEDDAAEGANSSLDDSAAWSQPDVESSTPAELSDVNAAETASSSDGFDAGGALVESAQEEEEGSPSSETYS